jgi:CheY-like chemotaxis protein
MPVGKPPVRRVLVVDDDPAMRRFVTRAVGFAGYEFAEASDGPEAFEIATSKGPFDLVLADQLMPQMLGSELARRLRALVPDVKVLFLTGNPGALYDDHPTLSPHEAVLEKPATLAELLDAMSGLMSTELS